MAKPAKKMTVGQVVITVLAGSTALIGAITALVSALSSSPLVQNIAEQSVEPELVSISGKWATPSFTTIPSDPYVLLREIGGVVDGTYHAEQDSKIVRGLLSGNKLEAYWVEDFSSRDCATKIDNRVNWGKLELLFNDRRDQFTGQWGYCTDPVNLPVYGIKVK